MPPSKNDIRYFKYIVEFIFSNRKTISNDNWMFEEPYYSGFDKKILYKLEDGLVSILREDLAGKTFKTRAQIEKFLKENYFGDYPACAFLRGEK